MLLGWNTSGKQLYSYIYLLKSKIHRLCVFLERRGVQVCCQIKLCFFFWHPMPSLFLRFRSCSCQTGRQSDIFRKVARGKDKKVFWGIWQSNSPWCVLSITIITMNFNLFFPADFFELWNLSNNASPFHFGDRKCLGLGCHARVFFRSIPILIVQFTLWHFWLRWRLTWNEGCWNRNTRCWNKNTRCRNKSTGWWNRNTRCWNRNTRCWNRNVWTENKRKSSKSSARWVSPALLSGRHIFSLKQVTGHIFVQSEHVCLVSAKSQSQDRKKKCSSVADCRWPGIPEGNRCALAVPRTYSRREPE